MTSRWAGALGWSNVLEVITVAVRSAGVPGHTVTSEPAGIAVPGWVITVVSLMVSAPSGARTLRRRSSTYARRTANGRPKIGPYAPLPV